MIWLYTAMLMQKCCCSVKLHCLISIIYNTMFGQRKLLGFYTEMRVYSILLVQPAFWMVFLSRLFFLYQDGWNDSKMPFTTDHFVLTGSALCQALGWFTSSKIPAHPGVWPKWRSKRTVHTGGRKWPTVSGDHALCLGEQRLQGVYTAR